MATISTLAVNLIARTSVFEKGMRRSRKSVKSLGATVNGAVGTVARFAKGLAIAAGIGGMGFIIKRTLTALDVIAKMSKELQISTEALMSMEQAAKLSGTSIEQVQKGLQIMVRRLGEARAGYGEGKKGLDAMNVSAQDMIDMGTEKAFLKIADAVKDASTAAEKANIAYQLFGRSGVNMINLLNEGSAGFIKLKKAMIAAGNTISAFDAQKIEDANDAIVDLKTSMQGVVNEAVVRLAPAIEKAADLLTKYKDGIVKSVKNTVIFIAKTLLIVKTIKIVGGAIRGLIAIYKSLAAAQTVTLALGGPAGWATIAAGIIIATGAVIGFNKAIDATIAGLDGLSSNEQQGKTEAGLVADIARKKRGLELLHTPRTGFANEEVKRKALERQQRAIALAEERLALFRKEASAAATLTEEDRKRAAELDRLLILEKESKRVIDSLITPAQKLKKETELMWQLQKEGLLTWEEMRTALTNIRFGDINKDADDFIKKLQDQVDFFGLSSAEIEIEKLSKIANNLQAEIHASSFVDPFKTEALEEINNKIERAKGLMDELASLETKDPLGELKGGRFQEIRSEFIDVAALNAGGKAKGVEKTNELLVLSLQAQRKMAAELAGRYGT